MPLEAEAAVEAFTMVSREGLFSLRRVRQGVLDGNPSFQVTMDDNAMKALMDWICKEWVNNIVVTGHTP